MAKVLLVEDDNNLREIYQARLMAEGYDIVAAQNGEEALVVAKQNKPDLVISDVMMPRISGFEMLDILRNTEGLKQTKVIMLTALGQAEDQKRADNLGADKYLVKSQVTLEDIVNAAKELLGETEAVAPASAPDEPPAVPAVPATDTSVPVSVEPPAPADPAVAPASPAPNEPVVPASVVPQPDTTVVVPPAPANPTPSAVTVVPEPVTSAPTDPSATAPLTPISDSTVDTVTPEPSTPPASNGAGVAAVDAASQTIEAEEAALQAQIESYAKAPAEAPKEVDPATVASNDAAIAEAVEALNTPAEAAPPEPLATGAPAVEPAVSPEPAPEPADVPAEAPSPGSETSDHVIVTGKKVITPLNDPADKPNLDELLAKEEANEPWAPAAPVVNGTAAQPPITPPAATPGSTTPPAASGTDLNNVTL